MGAIPYTLQVGERWVNPLPDEASRAKWEPEKKDPLRGSFFSYRPSAGAAPWSVLTHQNCGNKLKSLNQLRVDIAIVRREKAHVHIVNVTVNVKA